METLVFNEDYLKVYYNEDLKLARAVWTGFISGNVFREAILFCQAFMEEHDIFYWLADNRKLNAIRNSDQEWFLKEIGPRMAQSSLKKMATIVAEDIFNQMAVDNLFVKGNEFIKFDNHYFKAEEDALAWLQKDLVLKQA